MNKWMKKVFSLVLALVTMISIGLPTQTVKANENAVAHTGILYFYNISDAWYYAQKYPEETIILDTDWKLDSYLEVSEGNSVSLEMNGHKIYRDLSSAVTDGYIFKVEKNATLNLKGTLKSNTEFTYLGYNQSGDSKSTSRTQLSVTTGGLVTGGNSSNSPGAIYMFESSKLNLTNVAINGNGSYISNWGLSYGGAILSAGENASITMTNAHVDHNYAGEGGGGIAIYQSNNTITMTNSSVDYNVATDDEKYSYGGGIYIGRENNTIIMTDSSISHNLGSDNGGGICDFGSNFSLTMDNSHIDYNTVTNGSGGGIYADTFNIQGTNNSTISYNKIKVDTVIANSRDYTGGGLYTNTNATETNRNVVKGITFYANSISFGNTTTAENGLGGAIYNWGDYTTIEDCSILSNSAYSGGGIYNEGKGTIIKNTTVEYNSTNTGASTGYGGGIFVHGSNDLYLEGKVIVRNNNDNYTHTNNVYLGKVTDKEGYTYTSHLRGSIDSGSDVGISTPETTDYLVVKELNDYIASAYKLDNPNNLYLDYNIESKELWQRTGTKTYAVTINGYEVGKYKPQDTVTINIDSIIDKLVTDKTEGEDVTQTRVFKDITSKDVSSITKSGSIVQFTMPNSDTTMTATFVTRVKDFTLSVAKPATGDAFPSTGTLTWTNSSGDQSIEVPVYWGKKDSQKQETGTVAFNTEYAVVASIEQDVTNDLAFSYDITNSNILVKYGNNDASASAIAQVDSTGTLNTKGADIKSVSDIVSVQTKRYDIRRNTTEENLKIKLAGIYNATVTLADGSTTEVMLDTDNADYSSIVTDGKVTQSGTVTIPIQESSLNEKNLINTQELKCSVSIELYNAWTAGAPTLDKESGTYTGSSLDITASLGDNATTLYYTINSGNVVTTTDKTITLSLADGEDSKEFTIVAWDGNPNISQLQDSDAISRTYTLQRGEIADSSTITSVQAVTVQIAEGSTADELRAVIPTTASAIVQETKEGQTTEKTISVSVNSEDISRTVSAMLKNEKVDYAKSGTSFGLAITAPEGTTVASGVAFNVTINVTKTKEIVATPVITASGSQSKLTLTATCATEGATIKYSYDNVTSSTYTNPLELTVRTGETESSYSIAFWAEKEGYESSDVASGIYTVKKETTPETITVTVTCKDTRDDTLTTLKTETYTYAKGASVQLIAPPVLGDKFEKWVKSDGSVVETYTINLGTLNDNLTITAIYNPIITELDLSMSVPVVNKTLDKTISNVKGKVLDSYDETTKEPIYREVNLTNYFKADNMTWSPNHTVAEPLTSYVARIPLVRDGNSTSEKKYVLAYNLTVKINDSDSAAKVTQTIEENDIIAYVAFPKTGKLTVQKIQPLDTLNVSYVDAYDMQTKQEAETTTNVWDLPTKAVLVIDEATKYTVDADITWSIPEQGFDKTNTDAQTFTVTGTLTIPEYLDLGTLENKIELTVKVSAQEQLGKPTSSVPTGTYNSTQTVSLSTNKGDAKLYYTTDGSDPTTSSTEYKGAFDVKETTTIKVFAVRAGMKDSEVATYTITINNTPTPTPTATPETKKKSSGWDDGGPFTTDTCGNVYDRWGNKIYEAKACNVGGYNLVGTSTKD